MLQGGSVEVAANVRRFFGGRDQFWPFARAGVGVSIVRFSADSVTGLGIPLHLGGGVRATVSDGIAIVGEGELALGFGLFNHGLGLEPQVGVAITVVAEFLLKRPVLVTARCPRAPSPRDESARPVSHTRSCTS